jgi:hypothetical protein
MSSPQTFALALLFSTSAFACSGKQPLPGGAPAQAPKTLSVPAFNGARAFEYLKRQTSFGPRHPNSPGHRACLQYFEATLRPLAEEVKLQRFTHAGYEGETLRLTNVIASFRPQMRERVILCAHWDTRPRADRDSDPARRNEPILGANDGASGVAVLLEIAALLKETPPPIGVDIVLFDGEDYGMEGDHANYLLGSRYFARTKPPGYLPRFALLLDMVGDRYLEIPKEGYSRRYAPDLVRTVWEKARLLGFAQFVDEDGEDVMDDHLPLNEAGIRAIDIIDFNYPDPSNRYWHTHQDTPENCSAESLEAVGTVLMHVLFDQKP